MPNDNYEPKFTKPGKLLTLDDWQPYAQGRLLVPNFVQVPLPRLVNTLACGAGLHDFGICNPCIDLKKQGQYNPWCRVFLGLTQWGGNWDGQGYLIQYTGNENLEPIGGHFYLCEHKHTQTKPGHNPRIGNHQFFCADCGLDLSYDSGD